MLMLIAVSMAVIAAAQCFHVFKLYKQLVVMEMLLNSVLNQINIREYMQPEPLEKLKGANRKPRTDEQKLAAAERRRQWWAKKKASESPIKIPDAVAIIQNEN